MPKSSQLRCPEHFWRSLHGELSLAWQGTAGMWRSSRERIMSSVQGQRAREGEKMPARGGCPKSIPSITSRLP
ncbi:uncharacterized protein TERG_12562 [Trichophyton rubrum CBS 118892]|uniref:Uncharacterized protein n=1 Tax=Trichophyton rubrum (strain ATCC MYA-4607 / CBS 118892) TaxID=559305 RepID=A0A080WJ68_TRIRC|nr:uncharacterized protein TERG_12562 [Trichophyton rubrum CBS 118892]KFL62731.1 hypothetical protein TERG_12562 [Trichophyton rubrum CBS 118892]